MADFYGESLEPDGLGDEKPRCSQCHRLLAEFVTRPWVIRCGRCKHINVQQEDAPEVAEVLTRLNDGRTPATT